jgi:hypothetical protein
MAALAEHDSGTAARILAQRASWCSSAASRAWPAEIAEKAHVGRGTAWL